MSRGSASDTHVHDRCHALSRSLRCRGEGFALWYRGRGQFEPRTACKDNATSDSDVLLNPVSPHGTIHGEHPCTADAASDTTYAILFRFVLPRVINAIMIFWIFSCHQSFCAQIGWRKNYPSRPYNRPDDPRALSYNSPSLHGKLQLTRDCDAVLGGTLDFEIMRARG